MGFKFYSVHKLDPADNYRTKYDPVKLKELADSIRVRGVRTALEVIPLPDGRAKVVTGSRRREGTLMVMAAIGKELEAEGIAEADAAVLEALLAERELVPCRELTADEAPLARELQIIENLQKEDVSAIDEARGFAWLKKEKSLDNQAIAKRIGCTAAHVGQRLKLLLAPDKLLRALEAGEVGTKMCEEVGRIPDPKGREEVTREILNPKLGERLDSVEKVQLFIRENYCISIVDCGFDPKSKELVPEKIENGVRVCGGECLTCPRLTGNDPDLQDQLATAKPGAGGTGGIPRDLCTFPPCFRMKQDAAWKQTVDAAQDRANIKVMPRAEAEKTFCGLRGSLPVTSDLVDVKSRPSVRDVGHVDEKKLPTWEKATEALNVPMTVARNPYNGTTVWLIPRKVAIDAVNAAAKAEGKPSIFQAQSEHNKAQSKTYKETQAKARAAKKKAHDEGKVGIAFLVEQVEAKGGFGVDEGTALVQVCVRGLTADGARLLGQALSVPPLEQGARGYAGNGRDYMDPILDHFEKGGVTVPRIHAYLVACAVVDTMAEAGIGSVAFQQVANHWGVKADGIRTRLKDLEAIHGAGKAGKKKKSDGQNSDGQKEPAKAAKPPKAAKPAKNQARRKTECPHCHLMIEYRTDAQFNKHVGVCAKKKAYDEQKARKKAAKSAAKKAPAKKAGKPAVAKKPDESTGAEVTLTRGPVMPPVSAELLADSEPVPVPVEAAEPARPQPVKGKTKELGAEASA